MKAWAAHNKKGISIFCWVMALFVMWELVAFLIADVFQYPMAEKILPYFHDVLQLLRENFTKIMKEAGITFIRSLYGYLYGVLIGTVLAILMSLSKTIEKTAMPYLIMSQMIPVLGLAPIIFCLVKELNTARTVIAAYITFFPVSVNMLHGLKSVDQDKLTMMKSYACSKLQLYTKLILPFSLPYLFIGLKIAAPMAVTASILVDTLSAKDGIGYIIVYSLAGGGTVGEFWPAILVSALMGVFSFYAVTLMEYICIPWQRNREE